MLRNNSEVRWTEEDKHSFNAIKEAIVTTHVLISLDFDKEFYIFSFSSKDTIASVLLQRNVDDHE
jgi:hypothetical protein